MTQSLTRRQVLGMAAAATAAIPGSLWIFALTDDGKIVKAASTETWTPAFLTADQAKAIGNVCEAIIPKTATPGALDARCHEYIDLELSVSPEAAKKTFTDGLAWLDARCKSAHGHGLAEATQDHVAETLGPISDEHESHPDDLKPGAEFFRDIKRRTIFAYYTSREGWVVELGRPEHVGMEKFQGCTDPAEHK